MGLQFSKAETLEFLIEHGMIDADAVHEMMMDKERQELLETKHHYKIYQAKDGRWKTTLRKGDHGKKLVTVAKGTREELIDYLLDFYHMLESGNGIFPKKKDRYTLREVFEEWISYKQSFTSTGTCRRLLVDWNRFYKDDEIADMLVADITSIYLTEWLNKKIKAYDLTSKSFNNMRSILNGIFDYCCLPEIGVLTNNPISRVKINARFFRKQTAKDSEKEVFMDDEKEILIQYLLKKFNSGKWKTSTPLMIVFNFMLGLRIGELCALKWSDIDGDYIWIQRMEVEEYDINVATGKYHRSNVVVVEHTKSDAGLRKVYLSNDAKIILQLVKEFNEKRKWNDQDYIFLNMRTHTRTTTKAVSSYLKDACIKVGISAKSSHKIRKSFVTWCHSSGINLDTIRKMAGHESIETTINHYLFDQRLEQVTTDLLEQHVTPALANLPS